MKDLNLIELTDLEKRYGKKEALTGINLTIGRGKIIGLLGPNGSGKTTLIKHLNGLLKAESGEIFFNGENIYSKKYPISKLRKEVGLVFQYPEQQLFGRTILKDVMYGPLNLGMSEEEAEKSAVESLELVGISKEYYHLSPMELREVRNDALRLREYWRCSRRYWC